MKRIFTILVLSSIFSFASHLSDLMEKYQKAPESQKYKIMNQIKLEIARLQKSRQQEAISKLHQIVEKGTRGTNKHKSNALDMLNGRNKSTNRDTRMHSRDNGFSGGFSEGAGSNGGHGGGGHGGGGRR